MFLVGVLCACEWICVEALVYVSPLTLAIVLFHSFVRRTIRLHCWTRLLRRTFHIHASCHLAWRTTIPSLWCERCLLITESPKTPGHYRYLKLGPRTISSLSQAQSYKYVIKHCFDEFSKYDFRTHPHISITIFHAIPNCIVVILIYCSVYVTQDTNQDTRHDWKKHKKIMNRDQSRHVRFHVFKSLVPFEPRIHLCFQLGFPGASPGSSVGCCLLQYRQYALLRTPSAGWLRHLLRQSVLSECNWL